MEKLPRGERVALRLRTPRWPRASPRIKKETGTWSRRRGKKKAKRKKERRTEDPVRRAQGNVTKQNLKRSTPAMSGNAIRVTRAYPEILLEAFNSCLREGRFFVDWKTQRLVLLRKGNSPPVLTRWSFSCSILSGTGRSSSHSSHL